MRRDRLDPVRRYRDSRAEFDPFRLLGRERHADVDVAVDHLRVVKPCVREAVLLGNDEVLPRVRTSWVCDSEFHGRRLPRLRFHPRDRAQLSREGAATLKSEKKEKKSRTRQLIPSCGSQSKTLSSYC